ncbi:MAG TPA: TIGR03668 family PPOX class F420-dependent oxidoreductase [Jiangellaceae bacterium]
MRLDESTCRERFAAARVARLATAGQAGQPHIVPVTFALSGETIVTAIDQKPKTTANLRRLRNIAQNPRVSLLIDHYADEWTQLWWVRVDGMARLAEADEVRQAAIRALAAKYDQYRDDPPRGPVIEIQVRSWRGWSY